VATFLNNIGQAWDALGEAQKAITYFEQALAIDIKTYGDQHPAVPRYLNNIGTAWYALGEAQKAIQYYKKAYRIAIIVWGKDHPSTLSIKESLEGAKRNP
jgi:tetratricopeptide (TPR) repeat protein